MVGGVAVRQADWWSESGVGALEICVKLYIVPGQHRVSVADRQVNRQNGSGSPYLEFWSGLSFICGSPNPGPHIFTASTSPTELPPRLL